MRKILWVFVCLLVSMFSASWIEAGEVDLLVDKLVEKGILTASEGQVILNETKVEAAKQRTKEEDQVMPKWVQNIKMKGDFRLRYQYDHTNGTLDDRHRARIRLRLGLEGKVDDKFMAGVGLATGLSDGSADASRSTNVTLENGFSKKPIALDYAYAKYSPYSWVEIMAGKFHNPFWMPTDLVWDGDINPEGGSFNFKKKVNDKLDVFLNTGVFVVDETGSAGQNDDPAMYVVQPGLAYEVTEKVSVKGAFTYNNASNVKGNTLNGTTGTNSTVDSKLKHGFTVLEPAVQVDIADPLKFTGLPILGEVENLSLFGQYVNNMIPNDGNTGFSAGFDLGAKKVSKFGDWQFKYIYIMLEKDAVLDILPDSDRFGGKTGIRSHEGTFTFGLGKNISLGLDVYRSWPIAGSKAAATVVQSDFNFKF